MCAGRPAVLVYFLQRSDIVCYKRTDKNLGGENQLLIQLSLVPWKLKSPFF